MTQNMTCAALLIQASAGGRGSTCLLWGADGACTAVSVLLIFYIYRFDTRIICMGTICPLMSMGVASV